MSKKISLTDTVKTAIQQCVLSRYEIARRSGVPNSVLSRFVNGITDLSLANLDRLADTIGLQVSIEKRKG